LFLNFVVIVILHSNLHELENTVSMQITPCLEPCCCSLCRLS
jgi:hypothetical protein